jgi:signal transduction histidine kinase
MVGLFFGLRIVQKESGKVLQLTAQKYAIEFEKELQNLKLHQQSLESFVLTVVDSVYPLSIISRMESIKRNVTYYCKHSRPFSLWVVFNPDYLGEPLVISMFDSTGSGQYCFEPNYDIRQYDPYGEETLWWRNAIKYGEVWTPPYYWVPWKKTIISYSKALYHNGALVAVMGSDFNFDRLRDQISQARVYSTGAIWLMDSTLNVIFHPKNEHSVVNSGLKSRLISPEPDKSTLQFRSNGKKRIMAYQRLSNGWLLCVSAPRSEIYRGVNRILASVFIIVALTILIGVIVSSRLAKAITDPIHRFVESFVKGSTGDLSVRVDETSNDEMRLLECHFNHFMDKTQRMFQELHVAQESLREAKNSAVEANKLKTAFLANMSHEIRTPLNAVIGFTCLLKNENMDEAERARYINHVINNAYGLLSVVESLIELSTLEVGRVEVRPKPFPVDVFIRSTLETFTSNYRFEIPQDIDLHWAIANGFESKNLCNDEHLIFRILTHLLDNALKFTERGSVELGVTDIEGQLVFFVKDTGRGIPQAFHGKIWESFFKGEGSNDKFTRGAGLGLAIARKLADVIGGKLWFESEVGRGTCFYLSVPELSVTSNSLAEATPIKYPEVLVIDEEIESFREIQRVVSGHGLKLLWARNGVEALGLMTMEPTIKLVICNLFSNSMEGVISVQLIKNSNRAVQILVIGNPQTIGEFKTRYGIEIDFFSYVLIDEALLHAVLTPLAQKK